MHRHDGLRSTFDATWAEIEQRLGEGHDPVPVRAILAKIWLREALPISASFEPEDLWSSNTLFPTLSKDKGDMAGGRESGGF